jgi:hypothetical protein
MSPQKRTEKEFRMSENKWTSTDDNKAGATLTAYKVRNLLNEALKAIDARTSDGDLKVVAGPQVYQYAKAGKIDGLTSSETTGRLFTQEDAEKFVIGYMAKNYKTKWEALKAAAEANVDEFDADKLMDDESIVEDEELQDA